MRDAEQIEDLIETDIAFTLGGEPSAEQQVLPHRKVGEEASLLEHVADAPAVFRNEDSLFGIDEHRVVEHDPAAVGAHDARDDIDQRGLARSGTAEERGETSFRNEARLEQKRPEPVGDIDRETHSFHIRWSTLRASSSDTITAVIEITIAMSVRRIAPASPPGICVSV